MAGRLEFEIGRQAKYSFSERRKRTVKRLQDAGLREEQPLSVTLGAEW
jgi:hypothetical protein